MRSLNVSDFGFVLKVSLMVVTCLVRVNKIILVEKNLHLPESLKNVTPKKGGSFHPERKGSASKHQFSGCQSVSFGEGTSCKPPQRLIHGVLKVSEQILGRTCMAYITNPMAVFKNAGL